MGTYNTVDFMNIFHTPEVYSALISAFGVISASLFAGFFAFFISSRFRKRNELEQKYLTALDDIDFLLAVEKLHCEEAKNRNGTSSKNRIRSKILSNGDLRWSGRFIRSRIRSQKEHIEYNRYIRSNAEK
jgi:hypothetical protein